MVVSDFTARILFTIVTDTEGKAHRHGTIQEVLSTGEAIVTCSVTHVRVTGGLAFPVETGSDLMVARVVGHVIGGIEDLVLHTVVVGEELVTKAGERNEVTLCFIVFVTSHNVDVGEEL